MFNRFTTSGKLVFGIAFFCLTIYASRGQAQQIIEDNTVGTKVETSNDLNHEITGGSRAEDNLFHSFSEFSIPENGSASFRNAADIKNIIARITGKASSINGLLEAEGSASLFLINPQGIHFGPNAQLNIGGSFLATTASAIQLDENTFFSATAPQIHPLLTINGPIGLQFEGSAGTIHSHSQAPSIIAPGDLFGLEVKPGKTLALIGGDIFIEGADLGGLSAPGGRIELGSVAGSSSVSIHPDPMGWTFQYQEVENFRAIDLSQAILNAGFSKGLGAITIRGEHIVADKSFINNINFGNGDWGTLTLVASERITLKGEGGSRFTTGTFGDTAIGSAGDIRVETKELTLSDGSAIDSQSETAGPSGNISIEASEFVELDGGEDKILTQISSQSFMSGDAGGIEIVTENLILRNGGQVSSSSLGSGNGGEISILASESVQASGEGITDGEIKASGILTESTGSFATGLGGRLSIRTQRLLVQERASISVAADDNSTGPAGNLEINANSILLNNGFLSANTDIGASGNISISADNILLRNGNGALISTNAKNTTGGNIFIDTDTLVASGNSDITANAEEGRGGRVEIDAQGIFGIEARSQPTPESDITATSELGVNFAGVVVIDSDDADPDEERVELPQEIVNVASLVDQKLCAAGRGNEFVISGRGGLPASPSSTFTPDNVWEDWRIIESKPEPGQEQVEAPSPAHLSPPRPLIEAQGWTVSSNGSVILTSEPNEVSSHDHQLPSPSCQQLLQNLPSS